MAKTKTGKATIKKSPMISGHDQVEEFLSGLNHPLKEVVIETRALILASNNKITEHIKWNAPSFCIDDIDKITFNLHNKQYVMLVFHKGAKAKSNTSKGPLFKDDTGMLEWVANDRAVLKITSIAEVNSKSQQLKKLVNHWIKVTKDA